MANRVLVQLRALLWKNAVLKRRYFCSTLCEVFCPMVIALLFIGLHSVFSISQASILLGLGISDAASGRIPSMTLAGMALPAQAAGMASIAVQCGWSSSAAGAGEARPVFAVAPKDEALRLFEK